MAVTRRKIREIHDKINAMGLWAMIDEGRLIVSAEHYSPTWEVAADYYGYGYPWINPKIEELARAGGGYWEWVNPGQIVFVPN